MPFWVGIGIAEHQEDGEERSVRVERDSFPSLDAAVERLAVIEPPAVAGQATAANAYVVRHKEAIEDLGYGLRVIQAQVAGQVPPDLLPRGSERLGYGSYQLGGVNANVKVDQAGGQRALKS